MKAATKNNPEDFGPTWPEVKTVAGERREMTRDERAAVKKLVTTLCANYDHEYGCLPLDCNCVMLHTVWTGGGCKYFRNSVLPNDPVLEAALTGGVVETQSCAFCGEVFPTNGRHAYCSAACAGKAQRKQQRDYMRKKRAGELKSRL